MAGLSVAFCRSSLLVERCSIPLLRHIAGFRQTKYPLGLFGRQLQTSSSKYDGQGLSSEQHQNPNLVSKDIDDYRERFIPLTRRYAVSLLLQDEGVLTDSEKKSFEKFALALDSVISTRYASSIQELKQLFDPLNPDKDTLTHRHLTQQDRLENEFWLLQRLSHIMEKANFHEIPTAEMNRLLTEHETGEGVKVGVDTSKYDVLKFWVLGRESVHHQHSLLKKLGLALSGQSTRSEFLSYRRVIAAVRLKSDDKLTLKAFKDIPSSHLEKLLPAGKIKMGRFDRYMIGVSVSLSGLGILAKFITVLAKMTVNWMLGFAAITGLLGMRGYIAYKNKKGTYLSTLNGMLYYKNIANNRGLITLVADRAEDESFKEALLTYSLIHSLQISSSDFSGTGSGISIAMLETAIEDWIVRHTGLSVEFDSADAVELLEQVGILSKAGQGSTARVTVLPVESAQKVLPQTPLSVLSRPEESDIIEGYDRSRYIEPSSLGVRKTPSWLPSLPKLPWSR